MHINPNTFDREDAVTLAYRFSAYYAYDIQNTFREWKEDDRARAGWSHE